MTLSLVASHKASFGQRASTYEDTASAPKSGFVCVCACTMTLSPTKAEIQACYHQPCWRLKYEPMIKERGTLASVGSEEERM